MVTKIGVTKFIKNYTYMQQSSIAASPTISYVLHNFGRPDSRLIFNKGFAGCDPMDYSRVFPCNYKVDKLSSILQ